MSLYQKKPAGRYDLVPDEDQPQPAVSHTLEPVPEPEVVSRPVHESVSEKPADRYDLIPAEDQPQLAASHTLEPAPELGVDRPVHESVSEKPADRIEKLEAEIQKAEEQLKQLEQDEIQEKAKAIAELQQVVMQKRQEKLKLLLQKQEPTPQDLQWIKKEIQTEELQNKVEKLLEQQKLLQQKRNEAFTLRQLEQSMQKAEQELLSFQQAQPTNQAWDKWIALELEVLEVQKEVYKKLEMLDTQRKQPLNLELEDPQNAHLYTKELEVLEVEKEVYKKLEMLDTQRKQLLNLELEDPQNAHLYTNLSEIEELLLHNPKPLSIQEEQWVKVNLEQWVRAKMLKLIEEEDALKHVQKMEELLLYKTKPFTTQEQQWIKETLEQWLRTKEKQRIIRKLQGYIQEQNTQRDKIFDNLKKVFGQESDLTDQVGVKEFMIQAMLNELENAKQRGIPMSDDKLKSLSKSLHDQNVQQHTLYLQAIEVEFQIKKANSYLSLLESQQLSMQQQQELIALLQHERILELKQQKLEDIVDETLQNLKRMDSLLTLLPKKEPLTPQAVLLMEQQAVLKQITERGIPKIIDEIATDIVAKDIPPEIWDKQKQLVRLVEKTHTDIRTLILEEVSQTLTKQAPSALAAAVPTARSFLQRTAYPTAGPTLVSPLHDVRVAAVRVAAGEMEQLLTTQKPISEILSQNFYLTSLVIWRYYRYLKI